MPVALEPCLNRTLRDRSSWKRFCMLLGEYIVIAHAKDRGADDSFQTAGGGILDYDQYVRLLRAAAFDGPLILHGLKEGQVDAARQFLRDKLQRR